MLVLRERFNGGVGRQDAVFSREKARRGGDLLMKIVSEGN